MYKSFFALLLCFTTLQANVCDFITYKESDVYKVTEYNPSDKGVYVLIEDWYEETSNWYFCEYSSDWCYPVFYPTLAVRYGQNIN